MFDVKNLYAVVAQSEPFFRPVDCALLPQYTDYVYHPMDFTTLERVSCLLLLLLLYVVTHAPFHAPVLRPTSWPNARDRRDGEVN